MRNCFKVGLIRQGLTHDLSKYSPSEFWAGARYYQGNRSPQAREREVLGYSAAWLHHKGRNKHHFEYWTDYIGGKKVYIKMPPKYFAEMICDRIAASKIYMKDKYDDSLPLEYLKTKTDRDGMNAETQRVVTFRGLKLFGSRNVYVVLRSASQLFDGVFLILIAVVFAELIDSLFND